MARSLLMMILILQGLQSFCQIDTVATKQGLILEGIIKSLSGSALMFSTPFTNDAISLKWREISYIKTVRAFKVLDKRGNLLIGRITLDSANSNMFYIETKDSIFTFNKNDIGQISKYDPSNIKDKLDFKIDIGYIVAKANNSRQASLGVKLGYEAKKWQFGFDYASFGSKVDTIIASRGSISLSAALILPRNWFVTARTNYFSSSEQQLDYRSTNSIGAGKYMIRKVNHELRTLAGASYNLEKFTVSPKEFSSAELFGSVHHQYNIKKGLNLLSDLVVSPSFTERW